MADLAAGSGFILHQAGTFHCDGQFFVMKKEYCSSVLVQFAYFSRKPSGKL